MKKVLSIFLAVLMIASTVAISGIVTASADTNPSDDAYVYNFAETDGRKSGIAYDFADITLDSAKLADYTATIWVYIGQKYVGVAPTYDFLISLYTDGQYDAAVGANYSEKWVMRKEWKSGLTVGWNKIETGLSSWVQGSTSNNYTKAAYAAWQESGNITAMTFHENSTAGTAAYNSYNFAISSFTISDGTNTYNVIDPAATKSASDIVNCLTSNTREDALAVDTVANLEANKMPTEPPSPEESVTLISPYTEKTTDDMYQIAVDGNENFSVATTATLEGGTEGVPADTAYLIDQVNAVAKAGGMIKVGGADGVNVANVYDDFVNGLLYVNAWVYIEDASTMTGGLIFRMFERYDATGFTNYIEYGLNNNSVAQANLVDGWNHVSIPLTCLATTANKNNCNARAYQSFQATQTIHYITFYNHNTSLSDIAVAAVELSTVQGEEDWDVDIEGSKIVYKPGEQPAAADFTVTVNGQIAPTSELTVSAIDTTEAGRQFITVTYGELEIPYEIYYKATAGQMNYGDNTKGTDPAALAGNRNKDNFVVGNSSIQHTGTSAFGYHVANEPLNLYGEKDLEMFIYFSFNPANVNFRVILEMGSYINGSQNCVRFAIIPEFFVNQGCKAGWNKVYIPLDALYSTNDADSAYINGVRTNWQHDSQNTVAGRMQYNVEAIKSYRIWTDILPAGNVILVNGLGYGMDTMINGAYAGNDLATAVKNAKDGDTVKLNWNETVSESVVVDKDITIDLNGNNIYGACDPIIKVDGGSLKLVDTNESYNHSISGKDVVGYATKGSVIATVNGNSAIGLRGSLEEVTETYTYLNVAKEVTLVADYGVDVIPTNKNKGDGRCYGVVADLYGDMDVVGGANNSCNVYVNGYTIGTPVINVYSGEYTVEDGMTHFSIAAVTDINIYGGVFNGEVIGGTTTTPEPKAELEVTGGVFYADETFKDGVGEMTYVDADDASVAYIGNWQEIANLKGANNKTLKRSTDKGDSYTFAFTGTAFAIDGYTSPTYGKIEINVDGTKYTVDLYSAETVYQKQIFAAVLAEGTHTVTVTALGTKNAAATRPTLFYNAIDGIEVAGELVDVTAYATLGNKDVTLKKNNAKFIIETAFINGVEETGLVASAENGVVTVEGNTISYVAGGMTDVITYNMNGVEGTITVTLADGLALEAEALFTSYNKNDEPIESEIKYAWKFSGHNAIKLDAGEYVGATIDGNGFTVIGYRSANYGRVAVYVDGVEIDVFNTKTTTVDQDYQYEVYTVTGLGEGEHLVELVALQACVIDAIVVE